MNTHKFRTPGRASRLGNRPKGRMPAPLGLLALCAAFAPAEALAQRTSENAVKAAEDAFGVSVGRETIGLYSTSSVRGFSPNSAGNARIDGLYFDPVWTPSARIRQSTNIRVGLSAQGFPFPAPTGVVDYALKSPGTDPSASIYVSADSYENLVLEADGALPLGQTLSLGGGVTVARTSYHDGTKGAQDLQGVIAVWRPSSKVTIRPFWSRSHLHGDAFGPTYVPADAVPPPRTPRRVFNGPAKPTYDSLAYLYGAIGEAQLHEAWTARAGLFRSAFDDASSASNLLLDVQPDGRARQLFLLDPPSKLGSTSGELRLTRSLAEGPRAHRLHVSVRGRERRDRYGGTASLDLGDTVIGRPVAPLTGPFPFTAQTVDEVRQWTSGVAYEGRWRGLGEISLSLQKTDYRKVVAQPNRPEAVSEARPWLYSLAGAAYLSPSLVLYAGHTRGLEESGVAPANAANRDEALPAIRTAQTDAGLRWTVRPGLRVVAGLFEVRKPYLNLDAANVFTVLGKVEHRGLEASVSGALTPRLDIVAGGVLMRPRVTGEGVALGRVGRRPVGQAARNLQLNLDWRPPGLEALSLDLGVSHLSKRAARRDNLVDLPARTLVDVGARYKLQLAGKDASLRLRVTNLFDAYYFNLRGSGAYEITPGRVASLALAVDF